MDHLLALIKAITPIATPVSLLNLLLRHLHECNYILNKAQVTMINLRLVNWSVCPLQKELRPSLRRPMQKRLLGNRNLLNPKNPPKDASSLNIFLFIKIWTSLKSSIKSEKELMGTRLYTHDCRKVFKAQEIKTGNLVALKKVILKEEEKGKEKHRDGVRSFSRIK